MSQWNSADEILDFAVQNEEAAAAFYTDLAEKAKSDSMKGLFQDFAREEQGHKAKLLGIKGSGQMAPAAPTIVDLKIGDYLVEADPNATLDYQQALILAMKQEKAAFKLYTDMAAATTDADLQAVLLSLAQEEAKHKLRFEIEYDDNILTEN